MKKKSVFSLFSRYLFFSILLVWGAHRVVEEYKMSSISLVLFVLLTLLILIMMTWAVIKRVMDINKNRD